MDVVFSGHKDVGDCGGDIRLLLAPVAGLPAGLHHQPRDRWQVGKAI